MWQRLRWQWQRQMKSSCVVWLRACLLLLLLLLRFEPRYCTQLKVQKKMSGDLQVSGPMNKKERRLVQEAADNFMRLLEAGCSCIHVDKLAVTARALAHTNPSARPPDRIFELVNFIYLFKNKRKRKRKKKAFAVLLLTDSSNCIDCGCGQIIDAIHGTIDHHVKRLRLLMFALLLRTRPPLPAETNVSGKCLGFFARVCVFFFLC